MNRTLAVALVSLLCAAGCSKGTAKTEGPRTGQEAQKPADVKPAVALPSFRGQFTEQSAISLLFKDVDNPTWNEADKRLSFEKDTIEQHAAGIGRFPFHQQGSERLLFVFETNAAEDNDCHACGVSIGAAVFSHEGENWRIETSEAEVTTGPGWGASAAGAVFLNRIGPDRYAMSEHRTDLHFGVTDAVVDLFEVKPGFPHVFRTLLAENNEGNCTEGIDELREEPEKVLHPCYDFSGEYSFVPGKNADYDDLEVTFKGTHVVGEEEKLVPFNESERYVYRDGKYTPVKEF